MKKAQSQIITTVLIILLVLAAIVIVWQVVQNAVTTTSEEAEGQASCVGVGLEITDVTVGGVATAASCTGGMSTGNEVDSSACTSAGGTWTPAVAAGTGAVTVKRSAAKADVEFVDVTVVVGDTAYPGEISDLGVLGSDTASVTVADGDEVEVAALIDGFQCEPVDSVTASA